MSISKSAGTNLKWRREKWFWPLEEKKGWPLPPPQEEFPPNNGFKPSEEQATNRGPSSRSGLGQGPFSDAGRRPLLTSWLGPHSGLLLGFSTSTRRPDSAPGPSDKPPSVYLPQPLLARPLSGPRGCPSAGNLPLAPLLPSPTPLYSAESPRRREKQRGRRRRSGRWFPAPTAATAHRSTPNAGGRGRHSPVERGAACASSRVPRTHTHDARPNLPPRTSTQAWRVAQGAGLRLRGKKTARGGA